MRIKKLSPQLVNQIAAGEVVERPASVLKELLENSIDANAKHIDIDIKKGGKEAIRITDDGIGIDKEDLKLAVTSHATSKITHLNDLDHINSLGFRGEALASIASISKFKMTSNTSLQQHAWQLTNEDSIVIKPAAHPIGTTIEVNKIFYNTPARRKFLRADRTEIFHIDELVKRISLSRYDIAINYHSDNKRILNLPACEAHPQYENRIAKIFGKNFLEQSVYIDTERHGLHLWGWLGLPSFARNQNDLQYFYVNGRIIKDRLISHAVRAAYSDMLYEGKYPSFVLYFELAADTVDVNVHPTKHEVRFHEQRMVHDFISHAIKHQLQSASTQQQQTCLDISKYEIIKKPVLEVSNAPGNEMPARPMRQVKEPTRQVLQYSPQAQPIKTQVTRSSTQKLSNFLAVFAERYILLEQQEKLFAVNILQAKQYYIQCEMLHDYQHQELKSMPLLLPETLNLEDAAHDTANALVKRLNQLQFNIAPLTPTSWVIREIPAIFSGINPARTFFNLLKHYKSQFGQDNTDEQFINYICSHLAFDFIKLASEDVTLIKKLESDSDLGQKPFCEILLHGDKALP